MTAKNKSTLFSSFATATSKTSVKKTHTNQEPTRKLKSHKMRSRPHIYKALLESIHQSAYTDKLHLCKNK